MIPVCLQHSKYLIKYPVYYQQFPVGRSEVTYASINVVFAAKN